MSFQAIRRTKAEQLAGVKYVSARKVDHNTIEYIRSNGDRVIRLHLTDIVTIRRNGTIVLDSGGYRTKTTKERMNQYLPAGQRVWAEKGIWYINMSNGAKKPFVDGMKVQ